MELVSALLKIPELKEVPEKELNWLAAESEIISFQPDDYVFKPGDPINRLLIILEGHVVLKTQQGNQFRIVGSFDKHSITGLLPYSRASEARGYAQVTQPTTVLSLAKSKFREMINLHEALTTVLVHTMSTRIRDFTRNEQLNDKMMSLGKLSAGLAHELNNPSAAIVRGAQNLKSHLKLLPDNFKRVIKINLTDGQVDQINDIIFKKVREESHFSMMERSEKEDDLLDWLEDNGIENADEIAENLVNFSFEEDDLEEIGTQVSADDLPAIINWVNQLLTTERLVLEIEEASQRINKLVSSVKSYTHMDQAPEKQPVDIHQGIENTLTMLNHKLRDIEVVREYDLNLPHPEILVSELNQVWTNLIDNAADAMEDSPQKRLTIKTQKDGDFINVVIGDSGTGIPTEIQNKIFDPFFTTKAVGKGTGLGMEVVYQVVQTQHNGSITFDSQPGKTEFKVCLPIK